MNRNAALGLGAAFLLGMLVGHLEARYFFGSERRAHELRDASHSLRAFSEQTTSTFSERPANAGNPAAPAIRDPEAGIDVSLATTADPATAFTTALSQPDGDSQLALLKATYVRWAVQDPAAALGIVDRIPIAYRKDVVATGLAALAELHPQTALEYVNDATENYPTYLAAVLGAMAQRDPQQALEWASRNRDRDPHGEALSAIIPLLAASSLDVAARSVAALGDHAPTSLVQQVALEYAKRDPRLAYDWARELAQGRPTATADEILNGLSAGLAAGNPEQALDVLAQSTDPRIRNSLVREIASRKGEADLQSAWDWLSQYRNDTSYSETARNLLYRWAYAKPEEVAALLRTVTDADVQLAAAKELSSQWQRRDYRAYQAWVTALPAGPIKAAAMGTAP